MTNTYPSCATKESDETPPVLESASSNQIPIEYLSLDEIRRDGGTQPRAKIDLQHIKRLEEQIEDGQERLSELEYSRSPRQDLSDVTKSSSVVPGLLPQKVEINTNDILLAFISNLDYMSEAQVVGAVRAIAQSHPDLIRQVLKEEFTIPTSPEKFAFEDGQPFPTFEPASSVSTQRAESTKPDWSTYPLLTSSDNRAFQKRARESACQMLSACNVSELKALYSKYTRSEIVWVYRNLLSEGQREQIRACA